MSDKEYMDPNVDPSLQEDDQPLEEIDFDLFVEKKKKPASPEGKADGTAVSADYRSAYDHKGKKKKGGKKKSPIDQLGATLNAAANATVTSVKETAKKVVNPPPQEPEEEPEADPEIDDFFPEGKENDDQVLLTKEGPEEQGIPVEDLPPLKRRGTRGYGIFAGSVVMVLALIGVLAIVGIAGRQIYKVATDDTQLRDYDTFLSSIVMQDPSPFETPGAAEPEMVLKASLWRAVTLNGNNYTSYDDLGRTLVPLVDVADACHELFGPDCDLQPESATEDDTFFEFDPVTNVFHVSPYSSQSSFAPYTTSSKQSGATVVLQVGYVAASDEWRSDNASQVESPTPIKYMEYVLQSTTDGKQYVTAIRNLEE